MEHGQPRPPWSQSPDDEDDPPDELLTADDDEDDEAVPELLTLSDVALLAPEEVLLLPVPDDAPAVLVPADDVLLVAPETMPLVLVDVPPLPVPDEVAPLLDEPPPAGTHPSAVTMMAAQMMPA